MYSVIIPVHNRAHCIEKCVRSVTEQTYRDIEIIVVDDHSTDNLFSIIEPVIKNDDRVKFFSVEERGVSAARNYGIEKSSGEYIIFLDSDDFWDKELIETIDDTIKQHASDITIAGFCMETDSGEIIKTSRIADGNGKCEIHTGMEMLMDYDGKGYGQYAVWGRAFRRDVVADIRFPLGVAMSEDRIFMARAYAAASKVVYIPRSLFHVVMHQGNIQWAGFNIDTEYDEINQYEKAYQFFEATVDDYATQIVARRVWFGGKAQILRRLARKNTSIDKQSYKAQFSNIVTSIKKDQKVILLHGSFKERITCILIVISPHLYTFLYRLILERLPGLLKSQKYK